MKFLLFSLHDKFDEAKHNSICVYHNDTLSVALRVTLDN